MTDLRRDYIRTLITRTDQVNPARLNAIYAEVEAQALQDLTAESVRGADMDRAEDMDDGVAFLESQQGRGECGLVLSPGGGKDQDEKDADEKKFAHAGLPGGKTISGGDEFVK